VLVLVAITFYQMSQLGSLKADIERANQRAAMLRDDIRVVDALTDVKEKIHRRISAVRKTRPSSLRLGEILEDVARNIPEFVWLEQFREQPLETKEASGKQAAGRTRRRTRRRPKRLRGTQERRQRETSRSELCFHAQRSGRDHDQDDALGIFR